MRQEQSTSQNHVKVLTQAQRFHLRLLAERIAQAQQALQDFVNYLRAEHLAPVEEGWELTEEAFVLRKENRETRGN